MKIKNRQISKTFKLAKKNLHKERFICYSLDRIDNGDVCKSIISERLEEFRTYEGWMRNYHSTLHEYMKSKDYHDGRCQWLDSLIKEFDVGGYYKS